jgi:FkbM family methyltransferase
LTVLRRIIKKTARSASLEVPGLHGLLASERRYVAYSRLGIVHEPEFRALPLVVESSQPLVLDVGTNVGQSVLSTLTVLPEARVVGFEPNPVNWPCLDRLERRLGGRFCYEPFGLAARESVEDLYLPVYRGRPMTGLASFDQQSATDWLSSDAVFWYRENQMSVDVHRLALRPLDGLGWSPDVLKIDVEGLEWEVVRGAWETILASSPAILVETPADGLSRQLASIGYEMLELVRGALVPSRQRATNQWFLRR